MAQLVWDRTEERTVVTGVDHGVLYPKTVDGQYGEGEAWDGLTGVTESPSGAEATPVYADNIKYLNLYSAEDFGYTIEALRYPDGFAACDGIREAAPGVFLPMQTRKAFGFCYRTRVANEDEGMDYGYTLHIIYNSKARPSEKTHSSVNESPENETMSWECSTTPEIVTTIDPETGNPYKPVAHIDIPSTKTPAVKLAAIERILYGSETTAPRLPLPDEILSIMSA